MATEPSTSQTDLEIFQKLEAYPWDTDKEFQIGLKAILGPSPSPSQIYDLTLRAQCFYLSRKLSVPIDFTSYKNYLSSKTSSTSSTPAGKMSVPVTPPNTAAPPSHTSPTPQNAVQGKTQGEGGNENDSSLTAGIASPNANPTVPSTQQTDAPYPPTFAQIVSLITQGLPIPGIREIPDITCPEEASEPKLPKRRKPWEKDLSEEEFQRRCSGQEGTFGDRRDDPVVVQELPDA